MARTSMIREYATPGVGIVALTGVFVAFLLWTGAVSAAAPKETTDPTVVWGSFIAALNRGDAEAAVGFFSEEALFQQPDTSCTTPCVGRAALLQQLQQTIARRPTFTTLPDFTVFESEADGRLQVHDPTAGETIIRFSMATAGDRIAALRLSSPMPTSLVSAGTGGFIQTGTLPAPLPQSFALLGGLLGICGLVLLRQTTT